MRYTIAISLLFLSVVGFSQKTEKFSLLVQVQPELTFHQNQYGFSSLEKKSKVTFNIGLSAVVQYQLTRKLFLDAGLGFLSRKLNTGVFPEPSLLPAPFYDSAGPFTITKSVSSRILQLPVGIGYRFLQTKNTNLFFKAGIVANYILNTNYKVIRYPSFNIDHWQGCSVNVGIGSEYSFSKKIKLVNTLTYSAYNSVAKDDYLFNGSQAGIALKYTYLQLSTGVRMNL